MEMSEFLVVDKEDFYNLRMDVFLVKEFSLRYNYFREMQIFQNTKTIAITKLASKSKSELYSLNSIVQADTRLARNVYFVQQGIVDILRLGKFFIFL